MKKATFILLFLLSSYLGQAQVSFNILPKANQLYARNLDDNTAIVAFSGSVPAATGYTELKMKVYRNGILLTTVSSPLTFVAGNATFNLQYAIIAELAYYDFKISGVNGVSETLIKTVLNVVAGDVYVIQGQSNADATLYQGSSSVYSSDFIRTYGYASVANYIKKWSVATGDIGASGFGGVGQWGIVMAKEIIDNYGIPVAIFNGAEGGQPIDYFSRNDAIPNDGATNYGRLYRRLQDNKLRNKVRGILWYQGESNAFGIGMSTETYKTKFNSLHADWLTDFPNIEHTYIFQIRRGCFQGEINTLNIQEAHRQLALENLNTHIMATNGAKHFDDCHFSFANGYEFHGLNISRLVLRDLYGAAEPANALPPTVIDASLVTPTQLVLTLEMAGDTYTWEDGSEDDFNLNGTAAVITGASVVGNTYVLTLSEDASTITSLDYGGHKGAATPFPKNGNGIGLLSFKNFPVNIDLKLGTVQNNFNVHPNPASENINVSWNKNLKATSITIINVLGNVVLELPIETSISNSLINVNGLPAGVYFVSIQTNAGISLEQFVKE